MDYFNEFNYDIDGDGELDSYAEEYDTNGDGIPDAICIYADTDGDGVIDLVATQMDTDGDGLIDNYVEQIDTNGDGAFDLTYEGSDPDGDGDLDIIAMTGDTNGDGQSDYSEYMMDYDGDGVADEYGVEQYVDTDGDGYFDTYIYAIDEGNDGTFEVIEEYDLYDGNENVDIENIDYENEYDQYNDFENYSSENSDPDSVIGDPEASMAGWEFQGQTNRCALYSQMFAIEELTGMDLDIEEMADIAEANGWFTEEGGTPILDISKMLDYYGVENEMSFGNDISDIEECLSDGGKVIVAVDSDEIWNGEDDDMYSPIDGPDHAVEVIGIDYSDPDNPMVILNDSGHPDGCGSMIPLDTFVDAWEDGDCQMVACEG